MTETLTISYTPVKEDYIRASRTLAKKTPGFLILAIILGLVMVASAVVLLVPSLGDDTWRNFAFIGLLVGVFYVVYYLAFIPWQLSKAYKSNAYLQKMRTLSFSDQGVMMRIGDRQTALDWTRIEKVITGDDFYLMTVGGEERIYPFIPFRAFEAEDSKRQFLALLHAHEISVD